MSACKVGIRALLLLCAFAVVAPAMAALSSDLITKASVGDSVSKKDALENWKYNMTNFYESIKYTRYHNIAVTVKEGEEAEPGEWVSNWAYCTIKYKDGRGPVYIWVNAVYKIENGKIVKSITFYNEADVLRQLGYHFQ